MNPDERIPIPMPAMSVPSWERGRQDTAAPEKRTRYVGARIITAIETNIELRGRGIEQSPRRRIKQYWSPEGELLAEADPFPERERELLAENDQLREQRNKALTELDTASANRAAQAAELTRLRAEIAEKNKALSLALTLKDRYWRALIKLRGPRRTVFKPKRKRR